MHISMKKRELVTTIATKSLKERMTPAAKHKNYVITSLIYNRCFHILNLENDKQIHVSRKLCTVVHITRKIYMYVRNANFISVTVTSCD